MPISSFTIASGAQVPASNGYAACGGGLICAIESPASLAGTTYDCEYYNGSAWVAVKDEAGTARQITLSATAGFTQIDPPIRADRFRLNSDTNETADRTFQVHTI
jgi:hypothetical protein